ncbi:hypothetical protein ACLKA7_007075 [Drosophila subpalustris]
MWQYFVLIASLCLLPRQSSGFWWPKATTETPRSQVLQQIPLTYFRTYTYQPLAGEAFGVPLFGFGAAQTPLLSGRHYNPYNAVTSYAAARRHDAGLKTGVTPPAMGSSSNTLSSTSPAPTTTTTSTTTSTPAPTTTTTTTTTTSAPPPAAAPSSSTTEASSSPLRYAEYPTYTRRVNNLYNTRPQYPYPDYFNYQPQSTLSEKSGSRIQFVPCMCPISMPSMSSLAGMGLSSAASTDQDRPTAGSLTISAAVAPAAATAPDASSVVTVQARHMESEETELEEEADSHSDSDSDASSASTEDTGPDVGSKVVIEQQHTTPTLETNSLL